jgi:hypothetical protein
MNDYTNTSCYGYSSWMGMTTEDLCNWLKEFFLTFTLENYCREKALVQYQSPSVDKRKHIKTVAKSFQ